MFSQALNRRTLSAWIAVDAALMLMLLTAPLASPQSSTGRVVGTVTDPGGAIIAGAKVTVTNVGTGVHWETTTRQDGSYQVLELPIGNYSVSSAGGGLRDGRHAADRTADQSVAAR